MTRPALPPWIHEPAGVLLGTRAKVALLRALTAAGTPLSQRELARRTRLTPRSVGMALEDLVATGVVQRHIGGREHLLTLNPAHVLVPALQSLFVADADYFAALRRALSAVVPVRRAEGLLSVALFGSVARAGETPASDLDVLIVGHTRAAAERWRSRFLDAAPGIQARFGARLGPVAYALSEARQRWARRQAPFPDLSRDAVVLLGPPLAELLGS